MTRQVKQPQFGSKKVFPGTQPWGRGPKQPCVRVRRYFASERARERAAGDGRKAFPGQIFFLPLDSPGGGRAEQAHTRRSRCARTRGIISAQPAGERSGPEWLIAEQKLLLDDDDWALCQTLPPANFHCFCFGSTSGGISLTGAHWSDVKAANGYLWETHNKKSVMGKISTLIFLTGQLFELNMQMIFALENAFLPPTWTSHVSTLHTRTLIGYIVPVMSQVHTFLFRFTWWSANSQNFQGKKNIVFLHIHIFIYIFLFIYFFILKIM